MMLPPGRARLATSCDPTGSLTATMTTGIVLVACFAVIAPGVLAAMRISTRRFTSSAAKAGNRSVRPSV